MSLNWHFFENKFPSKNTFVFLDKIQSEDLTGTCLAYCSGVQGDKPIMKMFPPDTSPNTAELYWTYALDVDMVIPQQYHLKKAEENILLLKDSLNHLNFFLKRLEKFKSVLSQGCYDSVMPFDIYMQAAIKRAVSLIKGYLILQEHNLSDVSQHLIRLHLDTCLRVTAANYVDNPHLFALDVMKGEPIRNMTASSKYNNHKLTDHFLKEKAAEQFLFVKSTYEKGSGFVHFSNEHILQYLDSEREEKMILNFLADEELANIFVNDKIDATLTMLTISNLIGWLICCWIEITHSPRD